MKRLYVFWALYALLVVLLVGLAKVSLADGGWFTMDELCAIPASHEYCENEGGCKILTKKDADELEQWVVDQMQAMYEAGVEAGKASK